MSADWLLKLLIFLQPSYDWLVSQQLQMSHWVAHRWSEGGADAGCSDGLKHLVPSPSNSTAHWDLFVFCVFIVSLLWEGLLFSSFNQLQNEQYQSKYFALPGYFCMKGADTAEVLMCRLCCRYIMFSGKFRWFCCWAACACVIDCWRKPHSSSLLGSERTKCEGGCRERTEAGGWWPRNLEVLHSVSFYSLHQLFKKIKHKKTPGC